MSSPVKISNEFKKKYGHEVSRYKVDHLHQIDRELSNLAKTIDIDIMPGQDDLSTITLPQKPVPKSLFPSLSKTENINFTTNPYIVEIESVKYKHFIFIFDHLIL
jgi:DNA polymerase II small subunit/DNA polymerase delta subunit B